MHIAIIPDGNRRWAKANKIDLKEVYYNSCKKMLEFSKGIFSCCDYIDNLSLFFVSYENLKFRTNKDLNPLFKAGDDFFEEFKNFASSKQVNINWIGMDNFPFEVDSSYFKILKLKLEQNKSIDIHNKNLNVLIGYNVEHEINSIFQNKSNFSLKNLQIKSQVDVVIRTGGECRLSGFLPLNTLYSDIVIVDELFPDFTETELLQIIESKKLLKKNMGK